MEKPFRALKTMDLEMPTNISLCMLAHYVQKHLLEAWRPLLFSGESQEEKLTRSSAATAQRKSNARRRENERTVHSLPTLVQDLATLARITFAWPGKGSARGEMQTSETTSQPTETQREALELVETIQARRADPM